MHVGFDANTSKGEKLLLLAMANRIKFQRHRIALCILYITYCQSFERHSYHYSTYHIVISSASATHTMLTLQKANKKN